MKELRAVTSFGIVLALTVPSASTAQRSIGLSTPVAGSPTLSMEADGSTGNFFYGGGAFFLLGGAGLNLQNVPTGETFISVVGSAVFSNSGQSMRYWTDSDDNGPTGNHIWHQDSLASGDRMMQLQHTDGGDLLIAGSLTQMQMFDLAESFWERQPVEPGQLVAVDPARPDAVRPTRRAYEPGLVGVASARPAIVLGGGVFSPEMLRSVWGQEVFDEYALARPALKARALGERPELLVEARRTESLASYRQHVEREQADPRVAAANAPPERWRAAWEAARREHGERLFDATVELFFAERFAPVALAGRVAVRVDTSYAPIAIGDPLTSSPAPGTAMKATRPGPIVGIALEALADGTGEIEMLVNRGWYAGVPIPAIAPAAHAEAGEVERLRLEIARLERRLDQLAGRTVSSDIASNERTSPAR